MNKDMAGHDKDNSQDQDEPTYIGATNSCKKDQISTSSADCNADNKSQDKWPDKVIAVSSVALVVITGLYTTFAWKQNELTRESLDTSRDALGVAMDAMNLEQRPWLGYYGYAIQARKDSASRWEDREPKAGEELRVECFIQNAGKTPALNIQLMSIVFGLVPIGGSAKEPDKWSGNSNRSALFPNAEGFSHNSDGIVLTDQGFLEYSTSKKEIFFWARLYYCDIAGRRYWTQTGVSHAFGSSAYNLRSSSVGLIPGETSCEDR